MPIYAFRTTVNREDQVMDFLISNIERKGFNIYAVMRAHGMRGYIFIEAPNIEEAEKAVFGIPYGRGLIKKEIDFKEIEPMLEEEKITMTIKKGDIVEVISGPWKREKAKVLRVDKTKGEVVIELLEATVPIPISTSIDTVKVIRREEKEDEENA